MTKGSYPKTALHRKHLSDALRKAPIYTLAHGLKVLSERRVGQYIYCRVEKHRLFPRHKPDSAGRITVTRSRLVMTAHLGRVLKRTEHVHHKNHRKKRDDSIANLEVMTAAEHNKHHKTGTHHKESSKKKASEGMKLAYAEGRHKVTALIGTKNGFFGKRHSLATRIKIGRANRKSGKWAYLLHST